jgi:hypothetical protein
MATAGGGGSLSLAPCNETDPAQMWNITSVPAVPSKDSDAFDQQTQTAASPCTISSTERTDGTKQTPAHCIEVNGCNFSPGASVDTSFGCKAIPKPGNKDKCAANMAWEITTNGAPESLFGAGLSHKTRTLAKTGSGRADQETQKVMTVLSISRPRGDQIDLGYKFVL